MTRQNPIVIAYHMVWTAYGTWLPNDPRGSGSNEVASPELAVLGELHFGRKSVQPPFHEVRDFYERAEPLLKFDVLRFDRQQIEHIAAAFGETIAERRYTCYAVAILPDHTHVVIRKHRDRAEEMIGRLQNASRLRLSSARAAPANHPVWTSGGWKSFLDSPAAVSAAVRYVEKNPQKAGLGAQKWSFVQPYDGWNFGKRNP
jgi:REP element-mobilizing transposase RayT